MSVTSSTVEAKRTTRWVRTAGVGAMVGGGALLLGAMLDNATTYAETPGTAEFVATFSTLGIGAALLLAGAIATHARYGERYGRLGLAGVVVAALGFLSMVAGGIWAMFETASVGDDLTSGGLVFIGLFVAVVGSLLVGIGLWRGGVATRAGAILVAAPVVFVATFVVGEAVNSVVSLNVDVVWLLFVATFSLGWIALGDALRHTPESTTVETAAPAA